MRDGRLSRRRFLQISAAAAGAAAAGVLFAGGRSSPVSEPRTVRLAGSTFGFPSPFAYIAGPGYEQMSLLYDTLLWKDGSGRLLPWIAEGYERSADGLTYTFFLRDRVTWHDGQPLTAEDVAFTFEYFAEQVLGPLLVAQPFGVRGASARDRHVVEIHLELPSVTFLEQVAGAVPIIPKHIWAAIDDPRRAQDVEVLVGSGPYRLAAFSRGEGSLAFAASPGYFLGEPFVRRVELRPVDDELNALRAREIDVASTQAEGVRPELVKRFRDDDAFGIVEDTGSFTFPLIWNARRGGALADARFRRACALAIDRVDIVQRLLGDNGTPGNPGFLPPGHPFRTDVEQYSADPAAANRLLDEAGYRHPAPGGVRQGQDGKPLRFEMLTGNAPVPAVLPLVVEALRGIGVELQPLAVDLPTLFGRLQDHDNDIALSLYPGPGGTAPNADPDLLRIFYASTVATRLQGAQGWIDQEFDRLAGEQLITADESQRSGLLARMQQIIARDVPALPLYYPTQVTVFRRETFDRWYSTPGGFGGGLPGVRNKHVLVTGRTTGLTIGNA